MVKHKDDLKVLRKMGEMLNDGVEQAEFISYIDKNRQVFDIDGENLWKVYTYYNLKLCDDGLWRFKND